MSIGKVIIANFFSLLTINVAFTSDCTALQGNLTICPPGKSWIQIKDPAVIKKTGAIWLHQSRKEGKLNSFIAVQDNQEWNGDKKQYIDYAIHSFKEREVTLLEQKTLPNNIELLKLKTNEGNVIFYQGYYQAPDKNYWSFNCMGANKTIIEKECLTFMENIRI